MDVLVFMGRGDLAGLCMFARPLLSGLRKREEPGRPAGDLPRGGNVESLLSLLTRSRAGLPALFLLISSSINLLCSSIVDS